MSQPLSYTISGSPSDADFRLMHACAHLKPHLVMHASMPTMSQQLLIRNIQTPFQQAHCLGGFATLSWNPIYQGNLKVEL